MQNVNHLFFVNLSKKNKNIFGKHTPGHFIDSKLHCDKPLTSQVNRFVGLIFSIIKLLYYNNYSTDSCFKSSSRNFLHDVTKHAIFFFRLLGNNKISSLANGTLTNMINLQYLYVVSLNIKQPYDQLLPVSCFLVWPYAMTVKKKYSV